MQKKSFEKILVANRGEIALRIMRTLKKMNIKSVAVYSDVDINSLHVQYADEAYYIGKAPATESYLSIKNIIAASRATGASAIHPGYGFLSENANFANSLNKEGITLIGPCVNAIKKMGDKVEAKKIAVEANVNTVPGYIGTINKVSQAIKIAEELGFPVIVKAAAGGGGRGMRIVTNAKQMENAFESAKFEALNSFKDSRLFIEKLIEAPRHIEIQILADQYGNVVCLGERECSIQRQHQKVIEEAPSTFITPEVREQMYKQAIALSNKVGYYSAGTVEFIFDKNKTFYFLEMNTRLQVEHTVTELITGIDIVEEMIKIAAGERLSFDQDDVELNGSAIECRVCAEDPLRGFLPSSGRIISYYEPPKSSNIRIDSGIARGSEVSMYYDTMVAKVCGFGQNRDMAIAQLQTALSAYLIQGISHNISFLEALISHPRFIAGDINTDFIKDEYPDGFSGAELTSEMTEIFLATTIFIYLSEHRRNLSIAEDKKQMSNIGTRWVVTLDNGLFPVIIKQVEDGYKIRQGDNKLYITSSWQLGNPLFTGIVNGKKVNVKIEKIRTGYYLSHCGISIKTFVRSPRVAELETLMIEKNNIENEISIKAPLTGQIISIKVKEQDEVVIGQEIMTLSAMKMENILTSHRIGKIAKIYVTENEQVNSGKVLLEFE